MRLLEWKRIFIFMIVLGILINACGNSNQTLIDQRVSATLTAESNNIQLVQEESEQLMNDYGFIPIATGNPDFAVIAIAKNGEKMAVMTDNDNLGNVTSVNGAVWVSPDDEVIVMYINDAGLPDRLIIQEHILLFSNYTENTVDIALIAPTGEIKVERSVPIDLTQIRNNTFHFSSGKMALASNQSSNQKLIDALKIASIVLGAASCAATIIGTVGSAGAMIALLVASCGGLLVDIVDFALPEEIKALESVSLLLNAADCATDLININSLVDIENLVELPGVSCANLIVSIAQYSVDQATENQYNVQDSIQLAEAALEYGSGSVQVTLTWDNGADIDLWVTEPDGEKIFFDHNRSDNFGVLDVDDRDGFGPENIYWPIGQAPLGIYIVQINHYDGPSPVNYKVLVQVNGNAQTFSGSITSGQVLDIFTFDQ